MEAMARRMMCDGKEDDVPLVSSKPNTNFIADVSADVPVPKGEACIGLEVARDIACV
jgi:hypothetical protein